MTKERAKEVFEEVPRWMLIIVAIVAIEGGRWLLGSGVDTVAAQGNEIAIIKTDNAVMKEKFNSIDARLKNIEVQANDIMKEMQRWRKID